MALLNAPMEITLIPIPAAGKIYRGSMPWTIQKQHDDTIARLKELGIQKIVLLTSVYETSLLGKSLKTLYEEKKITVIHFPIEPDTLPDFDTLDQLVSQIETSVEEGESIMIHCLEGKRRTGFILSCLAAKILGLSAKKAMKLVKDTIDPSIKLDRFEPLIQKFSSAEDTASEGEDDAPHQPAPVQERGNAGGKGGKQRRGGCVIS